MSHIHIYNCLLLVGLVTFYPLLLAASGHPISTQWYSHWFVIISQSRQTSSHAPSQKLITISFNTAAPLGCRAAAHNIISHSKPPPNLASALHVNWAKTQFIFIIIVHLFRMLPTKWQVVCVGLGHHTQHVQQTKCISVYLHIYISTYLCPAPDALLRHPHHG